MSEAKDLSESVKKVRDLFLSKYNGSILDDTYNDKDVKLVKTSDGFLRSVLRSFKVNGNVDKAVDSLNEILLFRAKMKLSELTDDDIHPEIRSKNSMFIHGTDKKGFPIMQCRPSAMKKGHLVEEMKQNIALQFNKAFVLDPEQPYVALFDFTDAGIGNMDFDVIKFIIACGSTYFPGFGSGYSLAFKMGVALETIWKIIKTLMNSDQVKNTFHVNRKTILNYINEDQLLPHQMKKENK